MRCAFACSSLLTIPARTMAGSVRFGTVDGPAGGFRKDASQSSLATGSGDSADGAANEVSSSAVAEMLPAPVVAEEGGSKGAGGRRVQKEYLKRGDVGALALLTGNWGGHRKDKTRQSHVDEDLKKNPASLLCLQEAQAELVGLLAAPAVAGDAGAEDALQRRTGYQYHCVRMDEHEKTLLIAVRVNICERLTILESVRRADGRYKEKNDTKGFMPVMKPRSRAFSLARLICANAWRAMRGWWWLMSTCTGIRPRNSMVSLHPLIAFGMSSAPWC